MSSCRFKLKEYRLKHHAVPHHYFLTFWYPTKESIIGYQIIISEEVKDRRLQSTKSIIYNPDLMPVSFKIAGMDYRF